MSHAKLEELKKLRDSILLAEVGAWLHDVGKFCDLHIESHADGGKNRWPSNYAYKAVVDDPGKIVRLSKQAANIRKPDVITDVLANLSPKAADFIDRALKVALEGTVVSLPHQPGYTLAELIMLGMPGSATHPQREQLLDNKDGWLPAVLGVCHNEGHHDKQEPGRDEGNQDWSNVFASTPFGYERCVIHDLDTKLQNLSSSLSDLRNYRETIGKIEEAFHQGLGDTRRPINEVTLSSWSSVVAALLKSAIATAILSPSVPEVRQWSSWRDKVIDHDFRWRLLRVSFDVLGLYAKAVQIADLLSYQEAVHRVCEEVKRLVEEEYPLGNEVYQDTTGIYFTFPDIDLPAELAGEIRRCVEGIELELAPRIAVKKGAGDTAGEQLRTILANQREKARRELAYPFDRANLSPRWQELWENLPQDRWEVCPVCRLRPVEEGKDACEHCRQRRTSRIGAWLSDPAGTIWLDEIADHNDRVALIVAKFGLDHWLSGDLVQTMLVKAVENNSSECNPKNPSPARIRRVWETCQRFWTDVQEGILPEHPFASRTKNPNLRNKRLVIVPDADQKGRREGIPYDGTIGGRPISLFWLDEEEKFITIIDLQLAESHATGVLDVIGQWHGKEVNIAEPDSFTFTIQRLEIPCKMQEYRPYQVLLTTPDQFLALVPATEAVDIAQAIEQKYRREFGKVQNRLPLFLGLVFFPRKMPLTAVMDTARRMLTGVEFETDTWEVESFADDTLTFADGLEWRVPTTMGDGSLDLWYPYFFVKGDPGKRAYRFQLNGRWLVRVNDLQSGDRVLVTPSRFTYLFLEHTGQRFRFNPKRGLVLLDELPRLPEMWEALRDTPDMTDTRLHGIWALFQSKWEAWGLDASRSPDYEASKETFRRLVETTFAREQITGVGMDEVLNGRFHRCLQLYLHILKERVKTQEENKDEQESTTV